MVNLVWSFASILGPLCSCNTYIFGLFKHVRAEAILRLRATSSALQQKQPWAYKVSGGLNEQALANIVYAYEIAELLDRELLQWVFNTAAFRMEQLDQTGCLQFNYKPKELTTLLRAAHTMKAQPWMLLSKLAKVVLLKPSILSGWSASEHAEVNHAFALLHKFTQPLVKQQQQQQQQQQQRRHQHLYQQHQQLASACLLSQPQVLQGAHQSATLQRVAADFGTCGYKAMPAVLSGNVLPPVTEDLPGFIKAGPVAQGGCLDRLLASSSTVLQQLSPQQLSPQQHQLSNALHQQLFPQQNLASSSTVREQLPPPHHLLSNTLHQKLPTQQYLLSNGPCQQPSSQQHQLSNEQHLQLSHQQILMSNGQHRQLSPQQNLQSNTLRQQDVPCEAQTRMDRFASTSGLGRGEQAQGIVLPAEL